MKVRSGGWMGRQGVRLPAFGHVEPNRWTEDGHERRHGRWTPRAKRARRRGPGGEVERLGEGAREAEGEGERLAEALPLPVPVGLAEPVAEGLPVRLGEQLAPGARPARAQPAAARWPGIRPGTVVP